MASQHAVGTGGEAAVLTSLPSTVRLETGRRPSVLWLDFRRNFVSKPTANPVGMGDNQGKFP